MVEYPKAVYPGGDFHPESRDENGQVHDYRVVNSNIEEEDAKADGYFAYGALDMGSEAELSELDKLRGECEAKGILVKGTWGLKRMRDALAGQ